MNQNQKENKLKKSTKWLITAIVVCHMSLMPMVVYASGNYSENAAKWFLDQAFWLVIIIMAVVIINAFLKKNFTGMIIAFVVGGVVAYFCKNSDKITAVGELVAQTIFK